MGSPVVHWEINSSNAGQLHEFYSKLFGWTVNSNNPMKYGLVNTGNKIGTNGGIGQNDPNQPTPPAVTFYVQVSDLQATLDMAATMGGMVVMPPMEIPDMVTMAMFRDPEGNVIGLVKGEEMKPKKATRKKPKAKKPSTKKTSSRAKAKTSLRRR